MITKAISTKVNRKRRSGYLRTAVILCLLVFASANCTGNSEFRKSFELVSENRPLDSADIQGLENDELRILRNTIYARHGYPFSSPDLHQYFYGPEAKPFGYNFVEDSEFSESYLNDVDRENVLLILSAESDRVEALDSESREVGQRLLLENYNHSRLYALMTVNVIAYFNLENEYRTELQRKIFLDSEDYQEYHMKLLKERSTWLSRSYRLRINSALILTDYNLDKGGFYFLLPNTLWVGNPHASEGLPPGEYAIPTSIAGFHTDDTINLEFHTIVDPRPGFAISNVPVFLPCDETTGLIIEQSRNELDIYLDFELSENGHSRHEFTNYSFIKVENAAYRIYLDEELLIEKIIPNS